MSKPPPLTDPREVRLLLYEIARRGYRRVDGTESPHFGYNSMAPVVSQLLHAGEHLGYNGEDKMTMLAYHALLRAEEMADIALRHLALSPSPPFLVDLPSGKMTPIEPGCTCHTPSGPECCPVHHN